MQFPSNEVNCLGKRESKTFSKSIPKRQICNRCLDSNSTSSSYFWDRQVILAQQLHHADWMKKPLKVGSSCCHPLLEKAQLDTHFSIRHVTEYSNRKGPIHIDISIIWYIRKFGKVNRIKFIVTHSGIRLHAAVISFQKLKQKKVNLLNSISKAPKFQFEWNKWTVLTETNETIDFFFMQVVTFSCANSFLDSVQ